MNRLTKRHNDSVCWNGNPDHSTQARYRELLNRLAEYEDITAGISIDRLREICDAERDGRCVVLPKVPKSDKDLMSAYLKEHFDKAAIIDKDAGLYGMTEGEAKLANAILAALGNPEEAEAALRKEQGDETHN